MSHGQAGPRTQEETSHFCNRFSEFQPWLAVILGEVQLGKERSEVWSHLESPLLPRSCRTPALIFPSSTVHEVFQLSQLHGELQLVSFQLSSFQRLNFQRL